MFFQLRFDFPIVTTLFSLFEPCFLEHTVGVYTMRLLDHVPIEDLSSQVYEDI